MKDHQRCCSFLKVEPNYHCWEWYTFVSIVAEVVNAMAQFLPSESRECSAHVQWDCNVNPKANYLGSTKHCDRVNTTTVYYSARSIGE